MRTQQTMVAGIEPTYIQTQRQGFNGNSILYSNPNMQAQNIVVSGEGKGTLQNPQTNLEYIQVTIPNPQPKPMPATREEYGINLSILVPIGTAVRINYIILQSRCIASDQCKIKGIQLMKVPIICPVSYLYDFIIYFYTRFFLAITCSLVQNCGLIINLIILAIYVSFLILPYISIIQLILSSIFFIFYIAGVIVYLINIKRLSSHQFTQNMVHSSKMPFYDHRFSNQFYSMQIDQVKFWIHKHPELTAIQYLKTNRMSQFMAYTDHFVEQRYEYIVSRKMIGFHIMFMICSCLGLYLSVLIFPSLYGRR